MSKYARNILRLGLGIGALVPLTLVPSAITAPGPTLTGMALAVLYAALVLWLLTLTRPAWPQGRKWIFAALLWGSGTSLSVVFIAGSSWSDIVDYWQWDALGASLGGAYPEEIVKALGVFLLLATYRELHSPWHGFLAGAVVGLGFETSENIFYGFMGALTDPVSDWGGFWNTWLLRIVFGTCLHVVLTGIAGWGLGWAIFAAGWSRTKRIGYAGGFLGLAFAGHFTWNLMLDTQAWWAYVPPVTSAVVVYSTFFVLARRAHQLAKTDDTTPPDAAKLKGGAPRLPS